VRRSPLPALAALLLVILLSSCSLTPSSPPGPQTLTLSPSTVSVRAGSPQQFTPSLAGLSLTWSVNGTVGGSTTLGTIDVNGNYLAPAVLPSPNSVTISAAETSKPSITGSSDVTLLNPIPQVTSVAPSQINVGAFTLTISGADFVNGATVSWFNYPNHHVQLEHSADGKRDRNECPNRFRSGCRHESESRIDILE